MSIVLSTTCPHNWVNPTMFILLEDDGEPYTIDLMVECVRCGALGDVPPMRRPQNWRGGENPVNRMPCQWAQAERVSIVEPDVNGVITMMGRRLTMVRKADWGMRQTN